ncbi:recombinase family protein [Promicromonospora xylanilytica]
MRVLGAARLSRAAEESTSTARQVAQIEAYVVTHNHTLVGIAKDEDVSGNVSPFDRPGLGPWLQRHNEWDALVVPKIDRLSRNQLHLHTIIQWARDHGKQIWSLDIGADITDRFTGGVVVAVLGAVAESEREQIRERSKKSFDHLARAGRWRGGILPYGYRAEPLEGGGFRLEIDPGTGVIVRRIVDDILSGASTHSVVRWLNAEGHLTNRGNTWRPSVLHRMLAGRSLLGQMMTGHKGGEPTVVRDESGMPVQRAEPLITLDEWQRVRSALANKTPTRVDSKRQFSLLGVAYCECGNTLSASLSRNKKYTRCTSKANTGNACRAGKMIPVDELTGIVFETFQAVMSDFPMTERVLIPGINNDAEIDEVHASLKRLQEDRLAGMYDGQEGMYREAFKRLSSTLTDLASQPATDDRWETRSLGVTYGDHWATLTTDQEKGAELKRAGVRIYTTKQPGDSTDHSGLIPKPAGFTDYTLHRLPIHEHAVMYVPQGSAFGVLRRT